MAEICVASHHSSIAALLQDREFHGLANREGFLVELRLDQYGDLSPESLRAALDVFAPQAIATFRHVLEGGRNPAAADASRLDYLQRAASQGVKYVDIEARTPRANFNKGAARLLLSYHNFQTTPDFGELKERYLSMAAALGVDAVKIACAPKTVLDGAPLLELLRASAGGKPLVALGMGEAGFWTRVAGPLFGSPLTYARGESAGGTAPGQPTWRELEELYRFRQIRPGWPVYGVIGNPIAHSLSPLMHNTALRELNLPGLYLPFRVEGDPLAFIRAFTPLGLKALSVTIPHKEAVLAVCGEVQDLARSIGAANTLILEESGWWGANTDAGAAAGCLEEALGTLRGCEVLLFGAGGAARAIAFGVKARGAKVVIVNRTAAHARALAEAVGGRIITQAELDGSQKFAAVINATPLGMFPNVNSTPLEKEKLPEARIVFDTVYNPLRTRLLKLAAEKGCRTLEGVRMFICQGACQFEMYTGAKAPLAAMEKVVLGALESNRR